MKNKLLSDVVLPKEEAKTDPLDGTCQAIGDSGTPVNADNEVGPAPTSSDYNYSSGMFESTVASTITAYQMMEKTQNSVDETNLKLTTTYYLVTNMDKRIDDLTSGVKKVAQLYGDMEAKYIVTQPQVREFETTLVGHFKEGLQVEMKKVCEDAMWEMKRTRQDQTDKFIRSIKGGLWISTECGAWLFGIILLSYVTMIIILYLK